jgi:hypothetical protein
MIDASAVTPFETAVSAEDNPIGPGGSINPLNNNGISSQESGDSGNVSTLTYTVDAYANTKESIEPTRDSPRLPAELMTKVMQYAQARNISLAPMAQTSRLNYHLAAPMIYETIYLNRSTLPGLARFMSIDFGRVENAQPGTQREIAEKKREILEKRRGLLAKVTTLVIDDIQMMFGFKWAEDLNSFCSLIVLPNVTKVIWREDKLRKWEDAPSGLWAGPVARRGGTWKYPSRDTAESDIDEELRVHKPARFVPVLPAKVKQVCIVMPGSGYFQAFGDRRRYLLTKRPWEHEMPITDRIMQHISVLSGDVTVRIHQPISSEQIHLSQVPNTIYSFYQDYWNLSAKPRLIEAFYMNVVERVTDEQNGWEIWRYQLWRPLERILCKNLKLEDMLKECEVLIRDPTLYWTSAFNPRNIDIRTWFVKIVSEMVRILHSDHDEVKCGCCGSEGTSVKAWTKRTYP